jgi:type I restriction-modification system DNA methylase subunit
LEIPNGLTRSAVLQTHLQTYFNEALKIDYENVFNIDFVDELAFPDSKEVVEEIKKLVALLNRYNLAELGFDIIGRIFERLIPSEERHNFGQYFTSADVVDLILKFCLKHETDKTLDPSCGAGTFLVRAYQHKKLLNKRQTHEEILDTIWGNDIAKFPASLSIINLAINDLAVDRNYPNVIQEDFFNIKVGSDGVDLEAWRSRMAQTLSGKERQLVYPKQFDAIVGNPPYTRQEEIAELLPEDKDYKENLIESAVKVGGKKIAELSKRAGIHAFFFVHGWKFLREGGRFGFIVSNSWLDTDYGRGLQEFFLKNYKIVAIIESKIERWFAEADVNTCIVILEKCSDQKARDENLARFVYLKKPLRSFIPPTSDIKEEEVKRQHAIEDFCDTVLTHRKIYENDDFRIYPILQSELYEEGFDAEEKKYTGAKWGKYLRAPEVFFEILRKCKDKLVPLKELAKVRFGIKTGANEFFYLTEAEIKRKEIENEFWHHKNEKGKKVSNKILLKAQEVSKPTIEPEKLKNLVLFIKGKRKQLDEKNIGKYIEKGESEENAFNKRPTCASREPKRSWFDLGNDIADLIAFPQRFRQRHIVFQNPERVSINKNLYGIEPFDKNLAKVITLVLNSTLIAFWLEILSRQPGGGGAPLDVDVYVAAKLLIPKLEDLGKWKVRFEKIGLLERETLTIFQELGANLPEEVSFEKVKADRLELDKIVLQDILGLSEKEHLEVYRAVVDLVKSRLEKAKSVGKKSKNKEGSLSSALAENLSDDFHNGHD